jgi:hypothetical protein
MAVNFNGRWVPMEVMDFIVLLWILAAGLVALLLYRMMRSGPPIRSDRARPQKKRQRKRKSCPGERK